ncbi:hypothetical protein H0A62_11105 [Pusillimonas harenae]|uniref:Lipoprotein n=2 Tax=Pollutimonas harenae TaxID=657015 RepID=A0A853H7V1_9BURK|nr:hypothetical protein [Pollutimonas harenae]NYT86154.1 hypothetical protein [Pollutimonas harenae]TEA71550.1 hypothetical protein ERD84_11170 [Pollutimonas harenae]
MRRITKSLALIVLTAGCALLSGCAIPTSDTDSSGQDTEEISFDQLAQTDFNRTVTIAMRDNLDSLERLLEKLYRRNPAEWRKTGKPTIEAAIERGRSMIELGLAPPELAGLRDIEILAVALDPAYRGDRVGAFITGMASMIISAHDGKTRFYISDILTAEHVYNAARNIEAAAWLLATRKGPSGAPLLRANEMSAAVTNLSFEREFGALIGRLDLVANLLDENLRRVGINYVQGLFFFNFLPVR